MNGQKSIYEFLNYRDYVSFCFEQKKIKNPSFSLRAASKIMQINPGTMVRILNGTRNISLELARRFAEFLKITKKEVEYFESLVLFDQAKITEEKNKYFSILQTLRKKNLKTLEIDQFEYFSSWYTIVIKEILNVYRFNGNYKQLAMLVNPSITVEQTKESVELLERIGIIKRDTDGYYVLAETQLITPESWNSFAIKNFQHTMIRLASEALDRYPKEVRDITTASMSISSDGLKKIREKIELFYQDVVDIISEDRYASKIYELNIQLFPLSNKLPGK